MKRAPLVVLVAVLLSLLAAAALRSATRSSPGTATGQAAANTGPAATRAAPAPARLAALRAAAALDPCPTSISPELPDVVLPCLGGGPPVHLRGAGSGVPTLVNVYGSWCGPCQSEMPTLAAFANEAGKRVRLVGVDTEDDPTQALPFAHDFGQHWPAVVDDDKVVLLRYGAGPPLTLFLDGRGHVVFVQRGAFRDLAAVRTAVAQHLGVRV